MLGLSQKWKGAIAILIAASSYGVVNSVVKLAFEAGLTAAQVTLAQISVGSLLLGLIVGMNKKKQPNVALKSFIQIAMIGIFGLSLAGIMMNLALERLSTAIAIVLLFQFVWVTILLDFIVAKKKPSKTQMIAAGVVILGTLFAVGISNQDIDHLSFLGVCFGFIAGVSYAMFLYFSGKVAPQMDTMYKSFIMLVCSLPIMLAIIFVTMPDQVIVQEVSLWMWLKWAIPLGILSSALPIASFNYGLTRVDSSHAAVLSAFELPVAIVGAMLILHETASGLQWMGVVIMLLGIGISEKR